MCNGLYFILGNTGKQKINTFKDNAVTLGKTVSTNSGSFHNSENVYLGEVLDQKLLKTSIKNPFEAGFCDEGESKVEFISGKAYVTLKCGSYLIEKSSLNDKSTMDIYTIGKWTDKEMTGEDVESKTLYNCLDGNGKEMFDNYLEELYMVSLINKENDTDYYFSNDISECKVVTKEMYREKKLYE